MEPVFFATPAEFRDHLARIHATESELLVGFYKRDSGRSSITWRESVDEALCVGWIDGVRRRIDDVSYSIRFTPRQSGSIWSAVNLKRAGELIGLGLMLPSGQEAFARRQEAKTAIYAYEQRENAEFDADFEQQFRAREVAWEKFQRQPAWYRRAATWWVISARRVDTRQKRLTTLIEDSESGRTIPSLTRPARRASPPS